VSQDQNLNDDQLKALLGSPRQDEVLPDYPGSERGMNLYGIDIGETLIFLGDGTRFARRVLSFFQLSRI